MAKIPCGSRQPLDPILTCMSSGIGGGISGGVPVGRSGGVGGTGTNRKNPKKFGKNLNKLTKAPAAPPVPVISAGGGAASSRSFRGTSSSRNGLLLLSTKSKSSSGTGGGGGGLLASSGTPKTAHDALLISAGAGGQDGGAKKTAAPAWGMGEKASQEPAPAPASLEKAVPTKSRGEVNEKPDLFLSRRGFPSQQQRPPFADRSSVRDVRDVAEKVEKIDLNKVDSPRKAAPFDGGRGRYENFADRPLDGGSGRYEKFAHKPLDGGSGRYDRYADKHGPMTNADGGRGRYEKFTDKPEQVIDKPSPRANAAEPKEGSHESVVKPDVGANATQEKPPIAEKVKDDTHEYMVKLAKERAEKRRLEEEERMAAQKERAAMRLRELEEKRLESLRELEEKRLEEKRRQQAITSQARKELSRPSTQVILEPLGRSKKESADLSSPKTSSKSPHSDRKNGGRTLYDPDRPFSSLVGGKVTKAPGMKKEERARGSAKKSSVHSLAPVLNGKQILGQSSSENKKDETPQVHMVQLSNLDELGRGPLGRGPLDTRGQGEVQSGPRMLFDPSSGSMVAVPSREEPKPTKKAKLKGPQKAAKRSEDAGKATTRRPVDGGVNESSSDGKLLRGKQGKGSRKDDMAASQKNKKSADNKRHSPRKRIPRTCGVLYKMDKSGNYIIADGCEPDNGYGAHRVPGGKVKNPGAHAMLLKHQEEEKTESQPSTEAAASNLPTEGFSFRNDPGFLQHQTDFEAQQQKILEDAWASLVENEEPDDEEETDDKGKDEGKDQEEEEEEEQEQEVPASKSGDDEYAAALAISPSMIGLNFDTIDNLDSVMLPPSIKAKDEPIDLAKFALEAASSTTAAAPAANPFSPIGVSGVGLWGGTSGATTGSSYGDLGALTGWAPTPFAETGTATTAGSGGLNGSTSQSSKLHLWGSSALDENVLGSFSNHSDAQKGTD